MVVALIALPIACGGDGGSNTSVDAGRSDGTPSDAPVDVQESPKDAGLPDPPDGDATVGVLVPAATHVSAVAGNAAAIVFWDWTGSGPATYSVLANPGGAVVTTSSPRAIVRGLTNGTSYTFTVIATNGFGSSVSSAPSNDVVPMVVTGAPDTPINVSAVGGNGAATISWPAPNDHGSPITRYTVMSVPDGIGVTTANRVVEIPGLTNGTSYAFTVIATNGVGTSGASALSNSVTPAGPPAAPVSVVATRGDKSATVTWTAPSNNGSPITGYVVTPSPFTATASSATTSVNVTGLTNGVPYTFTVKAVNALGTGPSSTASNNVIPAGLPAAPTAVSATPRNGSAVVYWTAPSNNGSPIVRYDVTSSPGGLTATTPTDTAARVLGLTNGTSYTFTVTATNGVGTSTSSAPSTAIVPSATGCAETSYTVTADFAYSFNGLGSNPRITVCKGQSFTFHLQNVSDQHPFFIRNMNGSVASGVTNNGATGTIDIVWNVPAAQSAGAYYQCAVHPSMTNVFDFQ